MTHVILAAPAKSAVESFLGLCVGLASYHAVEHVDKDLIKTITGLVGPAEPMLKLIQSSKAEVIELIKLYDAYGKAKGEKARDKIHEAYDDALSSFEIKLRAVYPKLSKDIGFTQDELDLIRNIDLFFRNAGDTSWAQIVRRVTLTNNPFIIRFVTPKRDVSEGKSAITALRQFNKKQFKFDGITPPAEVMKDIKEKQPSKYADYNKLKKQFLDFRKGLIQDMARSAPGGLFDVADYRKLMKDNDLPSHIPEGFVGRMDEAGNYYTSNGDRLENNPSGEVVMNPRWDAVKNPGEYVLQYKAPGGQAFQRIYTLSHRSKKNEQKYGIVKAFDEAKIAATRAKWLTDMHRGVIDERGVLGTLAELTYQTQARVGTPGNATKGQPTYGLSTMTAEHVKITPANILINYSGKRDIANVFKINLKQDPKHSRTLMENVKELMRGKSKDDVVFTVQGKLLNNNQINGYLRSVGFPGTIKTFRTIKGTRLAMKLLEGHKFDSESDDKAVLQYFEQQMSKVGEVLQHSHGGETTWRTAVKSYIDPSVVRGFFESIGKRVPKAIDALLNKNVIKKV